MGEDRRVRVVVTRRGRLVLGALVAAAVVLVPLGLLFSVWGGGHSSTVVYGSNRSAHALSDSSGPGGPARSRSVGGPAAESAESAQVSKLIALGKPIYCAGPRGNEVALTFDDGPGTYTKLMIAKLGKHHVKATFFVVGRNIPLLPGAIREERALGSVGDHTFTHPLLTGLAPGEAESEIVRTQGALERASGGPVFLFRPPYGGRNATIDAMARAHGLLEILWTVDSADSLGANYAQIERTVIDGLHPGAIILMHENHGQTVRSMLSIFAALQRKHLRAVSVPRLLTDDPPSEAQVRAGGLGCGARVSSGLGGG